MKYRVAKVEEKKTLDSGAKVMNLGLVDPDGGKHWPVEFYAHTPDKIPTEGVELDLEVGEGKFGGLEAKRPRTGGGGGRGRSLEDELKIADHRARSIEAQTAAKIVADLIVAGKCGVGEAADLTKDVADWIRGAK